MLTIFKKIFIWWNQDTIGTKIKTILFGKFVTVAVNLVGVEGEKAMIEFGGGCQGCGMVDVTLKQGVEVMITEGVPGISEVVDLTEHSEGTNPFY